MVCNLLAVSKMDVYTKGSRIGQGTYGSVRRAVNRHTGQVVAIKKLRLCRNASSSSEALQEVDILRAICDAHVVQLIEVVVHKSNVNLVFEYMETDLESIIRGSSMPLSDLDIKCYMFMLLKGLEAIHSKNIIHCDIKPNNLLINADGQLKLADFGLARCMTDPSRELSNQAFTRWYRAPEILFGSTTYDTSADVWAAGCVFAELMLKRVWLPGTSDIDQLLKIFRALGSPTDSSWPTRKELPTYLELQPVPPQPLSAIFPSAEEDALSLLSQLVRLDPATRLSAADALQHNYFTQGTQATPHKLLPCPGKLCYHRGLEWADAPKTSTSVPEAAAPTQRHPTASVQKDWNEVLPPTDCEAACPMSVGVKTTGTLKRTREAFESDPMCMSISTFGSGVPSIHLIATPVVCGLLLNDSAHAYCDLQVGCALRPKPRDMDLRYLRRRKLELDHAFIQASQDLEECMSVRPLDSPHDTIAEPIFVEEHRVAGVVANEVPNLAAPKEDHYVVVA